MTDRERERMERELRRSEDAVFNNLAAYLKLRDSRTAKATAAVRAKGDAHRARARELKGQGLSAAQIGIRIATEEGRSEPYGERLVRRWLAATKG
jgi:hypothetical protein